MKKKLFIYSGLFLYSSMVHLYAQDQNKQKSSVLEEIHIVEPKIKTSDILQDRNVVILDQELIRAAPVSSIEELLNYAIGVDIRQRGPFGTQADVSIDGGTFEQTLILVNGQKIIDPQTAHNTLNLPIGLDIVQSIEVIKGPSARIYGVNSLAGVINIITKKPKQDGIIGHAFVGTSFENAKEQENTSALYFNQGYEVGATLFRDTHNHLIFGSWQSSNGQRYNSGFNNGKLFYQGHFDIDSKNSLNLMAGYVDSNFGANGFYAAPGDKDSKEIVSTTLVNISSDHYMNEKFNIYTSLGYRYNQDDYWYYKDKPDVARSKHFTNSVNGEVKVNYSSEFASYYIGFQGSYQQISSSNIGQHSLSNYGVFAGIQKSFNNQIDVNTGIYINHNSNYKTEVYPGIEVSYLINSSWKVMFSANSASRLPSFTDLYLDQRPGNIGNSDLMPEKAYQFQFGNTYNKANFSGELYVFYRHTNSFIDWVRASENEPFTTVNQGTNKTAGINSTLKYNWISSGFKWNTSVSYAYLDPSISGQEGLVSKYALEQYKHQTILELSMSKNNWTFGFFERFNERLSQKSYWITDAKVSYTKKKYRIYVDAKNIFNQKYTEIGAVPTTGRWFTMGVLFNGI